MTTGDKIAAARKKNNLTQDALADIMGVTRQTVSRWESGLAYPEMDKVVRLCDVLDINCDYLLKENVTEDGVKTVEKIVIERTAAVHPEDTIKIVFGFIMLIAGVCMSVGGIVLLILFLTGLLTFLMLALGLLLLVFGVLLCVGGNANLSAFKKANEQSHTYKKDN